VKIWWD
jgi:hypothetical protein